MGVRGLQTYLERHCPEACVKVNLPELARQYYRQHGTRPVMVVDGLGCLRKLYNRELPWVYGGQWREYYEELRRFLHSFRTTDIDLVFIFDGVVEKSKRAEWAKRRQQSARDVMTVFNHIKKHGTQPSDDLFQMPVSLGTLTSVRPVVGKNAVKEWCPYRGNPLTRPDVVTALPLDVPGGTPSLAMLWFSTDGPRTQHLRLHTFFACMDSVGLLEGVLRVEPEPCYIIMCLVLHYMVKHMLTLQEWEVDAFLAQAVVPFAQDVGWLRGLKVPRVAPRPVHLAAVFLKGVSYALLADCACGWPITVQDGMPWNYFDGKLLHYKYLMAQGGADVRALCDQDDKALQLFSTLKKFVTFGTRLDQKRR
ncbi:constitutive coactivator of peroxisome proliferator-activated receptor gamma-like isoform X2 [Branchiostoma lanceolatum]|uniref:constitutive coactivator of peroxisome proliferator-activated receptor gamma-like isoform X2 n=1 Tax=Branchiostoma lanceolatum TaxID=7740 RepID=UPI00345131D6